MKPEQGNIVELDVRPMIEEKIEPFGAIMSKVEELKPDDIFVLYAPFKPAPLFNMMSRKGFVHEAEKLDRKNWKVTFWRDEVAKDETEGADEGKTGDKTYFLDNRGLEPPNPMMRTLKRLEKLAYGETLTIHNDRRPMFLFPELDELGYSYTVQESPEGGHLITIKKEKKHSDKK